MGSMEFTFFILVKMPCCLLPPYVYVLPLHYKDSDENWQDFMKMEAIEDKMLSLIYALKSYHFCGNRWKMKNIDKNTKNKAWKVEFYLLKYQQKNAIQLKLSWKPTIMGKSGT